MAYQATLAELAGGAEARAVELWAALGAGQIADAEFAAALAAMLAGANGRARGLAELAWAAELMVTFGEPVAVAGLPVVDDTDRLHRAAGGVLLTARASEVPEKIVSRLGRSEPLNAAANTYGTLMAESPLTEGWTRQLSPTACQLCRWWDRDGRVWPKNHPFQHHNGCACTAKPVWRKGIKETQRTRRMR